MADIRVTRASSHLVVQRPTQHLATMADAAVSVILAGPPGPRGPAGDSGDVGTALGDHIASTTPHQAAQSGRNFGAWFDALTA